MATSETLPKVVKVRVLPFYHLRAIAHAVQAHAENLMNNELSYSRQSIGEDFRELAQFLDKTVLEAGVSRDAIAIVNERELYDTLSIATAKLVESDSQLSELSSRVTNQSATIFSMHNHISEVKEQLGMPFSTDSEVLAEVKTLLNLRRKTTTKLLSAPFGKSAKKSAKKKR